MWETTSWAPQKTFTCMLLLNPLVAGVPPRTVHKTFAVCREPAPTCQGCFSPAVPPGCHSKSIRGPSTKVLRGSIEPLLFPHLHRGKARPWERRDKQTQVFCSQLRRRNQASFLGERPFLGPPFFEPTLGRTLLSWEHFWVGHLIDLSVHLSPTCAGTQLASMRGSMHE